MITLNSRAELLDLNTGERMEFTLVFPSEANIDDLFEQHFSYVTSTFLGSGHSVQGSIQSSRWGLQV